MMKYDDGSWHMGDAGSESHAAAHIGLYFKWCLVNDLISEEWMDDETLEEDLQRVRSGDLSATEFLWDNTSGKLTSVDLTDEGNRFTKWFYSKRYPTLLFEVADGNAYEFTEEEVDFPKLKNRMDQVFHEWRVSPPKKTW